MLPTGNPPSPTLVVRIFHVRYLSHKLLLLSNVEHEGKHVTDQAVTHTPNTTHTTTTHTRPTPWRTFRSALALISSSFPFGWGVCGSACLLAAAEGVLYRRPALAVECTSNNADAARMNQAGILLLPLLLAIIIVVFQLQTSQTHGFLPQPNQPGRVCFWWMAQWLVPSLLVISLCARLRFPLRATNNNVVNLKNHRIRHVKGQ
jgi:hypothetical protein